MNDKLKDDLFYVCSLIEFTARKTKNRRSVIVNALGIDGVKPDIARELLALKACSSPIEEPLALKPVYMKD